MKKEKFRPVGFSFPSLTPYITLFQGTDDETKSKIYGLKSEKPYAKCNGIKYELTADEIKTLNAMINALN